MAFTADEERILRRIAQRELAVALAARLRRERAAADQALLDQFDSGRLDAATLDVQRVALQADLQDAIDQAERDVSTTGRDMENET